VRCESQAAGYIARRARVVPLLEVALNGHRTPEEHPAIPQTPDELAREARASVEAGAGVLHVHGYENGEETLAAEPCAAMVRAIRAAASMPTRALARARRRFPPRPDSRLRARAVRSRRRSGRAAAPDRRRRCRAPGLLSVADAEAFVESPIAGRCTRVLVEPLDVDPDTAVAHGAAIEAVVAEAGIELEQVHHGDLVASWAVSERGARRGHGIRTGLEDTTVLPDGTPARDNAELVRRAAQLFAPR
jgi:uncharacterized protein (DUF849 family)